MSVARTNAVVVFGGRLTALTGAMFPLSWLGSAQKLTSHAETLPRKRPLRTIVPLHAGTLSDGTSANQGDRRADGVFEVAAQIVGRKTAPLPYTIWMPTIDTVPIRILMKRRSLETGKDTCAARRSLIVCLGIALLLVHSACSDLVESSYSSLSEAKRDGAIARGWLPPILPEDSTNIREVRDIDTGEVWSTFEFRPATADAFRGRLTQMNESGQIAAIRSPGVGWWPKFLLGVPSRDAMSAAGFVLYGGATELWAVNWKIGRGHFYGRR